MKSKIGIAAAVHRDKFTAAVIIIIVIFIAPAGWHFETHSCGQAKPHLVISRPIASESQDDATSIDSDSSNHWKSENSINMQQRNARQWESADVRPILTVQVGCRGLGQGAQFAERSQLLPAHFPDSNKQNIYSVINKCKRCMN